MKPPMKLHQALLKDLQNFEKIWTFDPKTLKNSLFIALLRKKFCQIKKFRWIPVPILPEPERNRNQKNTPEFR